MVCVCGVVLAGITEFYRASNCTQSVAPLEIGQGHGPQTMFYRWALRWAVQYTP